MTGIKEGWLWRDRRKIVAGALLGVLLASESHAETNATHFQAEETARLIAILLSAARTVIDRNGTLIDDASKGDKGFTPEVFERQVVEEFRACTGVDIKKPA